MASAIKHRGRDDEGYVFIHTGNNAFKCTGGSDTTEAVWQSRYIFSPESMTGQSVAANAGFNLALGQNSLNDFEFSAAGHQPVCNEDGTIWAVCDSEIYNYPEIKDRLLRSGHKFISNSDAEVIVHAYEEWGKECLSEFNGAWSFALYDMPGKTLFCACDRFCLKPFYYYFNGRTFIFASEIKALLQNPDVPRDKNDEVIHNYLLWGYTDKEATFFKDIYRFKPAHYLAAGSDTGIKQVKWWDLKINPVIGERVNDDEAVQKKLLFLIEDALKLRLRGNLPSGFLLSGGLDSSTILCLADKLIRMHSQENLHVFNSRLRTFSSCIEAPEYNEIAYIESVLRETGAEKNFLFPDGDSLWEELPALIRQQDEPLPGVRTYAQWAIIKMAGKCGIKVLYDGQGGDEIFGGYNWYFGTYLLNLLLTCNFKYFLREAGKISTVTGKKPLIVNFLNTAAWAAFGILPEQVQAALLAPSLYIRGRLIPRLIRHDFHKQHKKQRLIRFRESTRTIANLNKNMHAELLTRLVSLLIKGDRNSMAFNVLLRNPLLDHRIVEFVFALPAIYKIRDGQSKWLLRESVKEYIPRDIYRRTYKLGFPIPEHEWLLHNKVSIKALFNAPDIYCDKYINVSEFRKNFDKHITQKRHSWEIWQLVILEMWLRTYFKQV